MVKQSSLPYAGNRTQPLHSLSKMEKDNNQTEAISASQGQGASTQITDGTTLKYNNSAHKQLGTLPTFNFQDIKQLAPIIEEQQEQKKT